jgi:CheY-like chemotaxis protein
MPGPRWEGKTIRLAKAEGPAPATAAPEAPPPTFQVRSSETMRQRRAVTFGSEPPPASATPPPPAPAGEAFYGGGLAGTAIRRMSARKVLVADDDNRIRMVFKKRLEEAKFAVDEAASGDEAWKKIQENRFGVVVMDMKMPGLHGLELLSRLSAAEYKPAVVVCSAYEQLKDEFVVSSYPRLRFLVKPVPTEKLIAAVTELCQAEPGPAS